jgi:hypothetical protein
MSFRDCSPAQELAVGGVADVESGVAVVGLESEGAGDYGERFEGFGGVGGAAFCGYYLLYVAFDGECGDELERAGLGGDFEGVVEGEGFVVGGDAPVASEKNLGGLVFWPGQDGADCLEGEGFGGLSGAGCAELERCAGERRECGFVVAVEGPEGDLEGGAGWGFGLGDREERAEKD